MAGDDIQITADQPPSLKGGRYRLTVTLDLENPLPENAADRTISASRYFTISGAPPAPTPSNLRAYSISTDERVTLHSLSIQSIGQEIEAVFPPINSQGDHSEALPQVILNQCSLPWQYQATRGQPDTPWLGLLLFDEEETPACSTISLGALVGDGDSKTQPGHPMDTEIKTPIFPIFRLEAGQHPNETANVIDVPRKLLERILPSAEDLKYLAHVRRTPDGKAVAVVTSNRPPRLGGMSTVHLVSLEGRYAQGGNFDFQESRGGDDLIRLVSLYHWSFACLEKGQDFPNLLMQVDTGMLRLPTNANADAEKYLARGCAPLAHVTRQGNRVVSWYHGPLVPGNPTSEMEPTPAQAADELISFNQELGLFDVSYAAAWELGRFLALQSRAFCTELFHWKQSHAVRVSTPKPAQATPAWSHLPLSPTAPEAGLPSVVEAWCQDIGRLKGIPFNYLVPDAQMLPPESMRFFSADWLWLERLLDGAFSIGRVSNTEIDLRSCLPRIAKEMAGFLLRSTAVSGWPGLKVNNNDEVSILRQERLSRDIMICLFDRKPKMIEFQLKPEWMHFTLKGLGGKIPWREGGSLRTIDIEALANRTMGAATADQFAQQLLADVEKIQFRL